LHLPKLMKDKIIKYIQDEFITDDSILTPETKLISSGIIDSFSLVSLQSFIEREFGKRIPNPKMTVENCDTVVKLIDLINQF